MLKRMYARIHVCTVIMFHGGINVYQCCFWGYLLEGLVELALLQELQYVALLRLVVQVRRGDGRAGRGPHGLHDAGGDHRLLLLHGLAHLPFNDPLHLGQQGLLQTGRGGSHVSRQKENPQGLAEGHVRGRAPHLMEAISAHLN